MKLFGFLAVIACGVAGSPVAVDPAAPANATAVKFEVRVDKGLVDEARDGRLLIVLSKEKDDDLRRAIGETGMDVPPVLGQDVKGLAAGSVVVMDQSALIYPLQHLAGLPPGDYFVQAVFACNRDPSVLAPPPHLLLDVA